jgi:hypothetical protein
MTEFVSILERLRPGYKVGGQVIIDTYNQSKIDLGRNPSVEELREAVQKVDDKGRRPTLNRVRKVLTEAKLELFEPRGGLKKGILKVHAELTEKLGKPPTTRQIDELTKNLSKQESAVQRSSVISDTLNKEGKKFTISDAGRTPEARAKAAATLKAKDKPRLGQPRKTPKDILERERYKRMEDKKRDPKKIKRSISNILSGTADDVHHPFPKKEKETLRKLMLLDKDVNRKGVVREIEIARNELIKEQKILLNAPGKNKKRLLQINALMRRLQKDLRKTGYGGYLGFPIVKPGKKKPTYVGFDKSKSLAGLREGEKLLDKNFAKATLGQKKRILNFISKSLKKPFIDTSTLTPEIRKKFFKDNYGVNIKGTENLDFLKAYKDMLEANKQNLPNLVPRDRMGVYQVGLKKKMESLAKLYGKYGKEVVEEAARQKGLNLQEFIQPRAVKNPRGLTQTQLQQERLRFGRSLDKPKPPTLKSDTFGIGTAIEEGPSAIKKLGKFGLRGITKAFLPAGLALEGYFMNEARKQGKTAAEILAMPLMLEGRVAEAQDMLKLTPVERQAYNRANIEQDDSLLDTDFYTPDLEGIETIDNEATKKYLRQSRVLEEALRAQERAAPKQRFTFPNITGIIEDEV